MTRSVADGVGGVVPKGVLDVKMNPRSPLENERSSTSADDDEVDVKEEEEPYKMLLLAIYIVVGCGVGTLVMLCVIRKVRDVIDGGGGRIFFLVVILLDFVFPLP